MNFNLDIRLLLHTKPFQGPLIFVDMTETMFTMLYALSGVDEICETVSDRRTATFMTSNFDDSSELFVIIILNFDRALDVFYKASDKLKLGSFKNVVAWCARLEARPATAKGLLINSSAEGGYPEYHS